MSLSYQPALSSARAVRAPHSVARQAAAATEHPLLRLQRHAGNAAVSRLVVQSAAIARQEVPEEEELAQAKHDATLQREGMPEDEELVQTKHDEFQPGAVGLEGGVLPDEAAHAVESARGSGSALDAGIRSTMESTLGVDLSSVRVHQGASSDALARTMTARAFTTGSDVFLRGDASASDPQIMAHELTHVVQQAGAAAPVSQGQRMSVGAADDPLEREADHVAQAVTSGRAPETQDA